MKKIIYLFLTLFLISSLCFPKRNSKSAVLFKDPYTIEDINKLETSFQSGKDKASETSYKIDAIQLSKMRLDSLSLHAAELSPLKQIKLIFCGHSI